MVLATMFETRGRSEEDHKYHIESTVVESTVGVKTKESLWQELLYLTSCDPTFALCNALPSPGCLFAGAYRCRRFQGCPKHARLKRARAVKARIRGS